MKIGILIFDGAEELDFVGPYEAFTMSNEVHRYFSNEKAVQDEVVLIAEAQGPVACAKGMRVLPHKTIEEARQLDVLLIPGGQGTRALVKNETVMRWVADVSRGCTWVTSVCTGALILTAAGPARGKRVTTHWSFIDALRERGEAAGVLENIRYVRDGNVVTAAGVSAGIDMALWLIGQMHGPAHARATQAAMEYNPAPPYAAEV
jgi:transcriptional regulator GlxA family with amidase domain